MRAVCTLGACLAVAIGFWLVSAAGQGGVATDPPDVRQTRPASGTPAAGSAPAARITIVPADISERRSSGTGLSAPETRLRLHVVGGEALRARRWGKVVVDEAVDDRGTSLIAKSPAMWVGEDGFSTVGRVSIKIMGGFVVMLRLRPGARDATKIARVRGSFVMLVGGKLTEVLIGELPSLVGKYAEAPALTSAGVRLKVLEMGAGRVRALRYIVEAGEELLLAAELVDASGKKVSSRLDPYRGRPVRSMCWRGDHHPKKLRLKLRVLTGARRVKVPIALNDIPLPGDLARPDWAIRAGPSTRTAPVAAPGAKLLVRYVTEKRSRKLLKKQRPDPFRELVVGLKVAGEVANKARSYGRIRISRAVDDKGNDLIFKETGYPGFVPTGPRGREQGFSAALRFWPAARAATKIARVDGSLVLVLGGKAKEVWVKDVRSLAGKEVTDETLKATGVKLRIRKPKPNLLGEVPKNVSCEVSGNLESVLLYLLVDEKGKEVRAWYSIEQGERTDVTTWTLSGDKPAKPGLKVKLLIGAKTVEVPITLKDIPLP